MRGIGIRSVFRGIVALLAVAVGVFASAEEKPHWEFSVDEDVQATFEAVKLHPKDDGWLLTCRMRVKSLKLVAPISQLEFKGVDANEEVVWEKSHTIRRNDFEAAFGGGRSQFVRVFLKDVPAAVSELQLHYGPEKDSE